MGRLLLLVWLAIPALAVAKPVLALAPIDGDKDGKVAELIVEAADEEYKVVKPDKVADVMARFDIATVDGKAVKKIRKKLDAEIVVYGTVDKEGKKKTLTLSVSARGKRTSKFDIEYKSADAKSFKRELRAELGRRLAGAERDDSNNDEDEDDKPRREAKREAKRDDDDGEGRVRKRKRDTDDDDGDRRGKRMKRHPITQAAIRISAGAAATRRTLTYTASGDDIPPPVGTFGPAARVDAEVYPGATDTLKGAAAGFGIAGEFEKTLGVGIEVPGSMGKTSSINQSRYSIGARYRIAFGSGSFAIGASYWQRQYIADRAGLAGLVVLDMPDVKYKAIAPVAVLRLGAAPNVSAYFSLELPLLLDAGPIQTGMNYGPAKAIGFDIEGGAEILVAPKYGVRLAAQFEQVGLSFSKMNRQVTNAADRLMGITATFVILY